MRYKCSLNTTLIISKTLHIFCKMLNVRKIEQAMSDAKITKAQLYSRTKIARTTLDAVLNGSDAKIRTIETIANALGVPVSYFFDDQQASHNAIANGNSSVAAINSDVTVGQNVLLEEKVKHLEELLAEKERLIKVLMEKK